MPLSSVFDGRLQLEYVEFFLQESKHLCHPKPLYMFFSSMSVVRRTFKFMEHRAIHAQNMHEAWTKDYSTAEAALSCPKRRTCGLQVMSPTQVKHH